jgi:hypothetical protein
MSIAPAVTKRAVQTDDDGKHVIAQAHQVTKKAISQRFDNLLEANESILSYLFQ